MISPQQMQQMGLLGNVLQQMGRPQIFPQQQQGGAGAGVPQINPQYTMPTSVSPMFGLYNRIGASGPMAAAAGLSPTGLLGSSGAPGNPAWMSTMMQNPFMMQQLQGLLGPSNQSSWIAGTQTIPAGTPADWWYRHIGGGA